MSQLGQPSFPLVSGTFKGSTVLPCPLLPPDGGRCWFWSQALNLYVGFMGGGSTAPKCTTAPLLLHHPSFAPVSGDANWFVSDTHCAGTSCYAHKPGALLPHGTHVQDAELGEERKGGERKERGKKGREGEKEGKGERREREREKSRRDEGGRTKERKIKERKREGKRKRKGRKNKESDDLSLYTKAGITIKCFI